MVKWCTPPNQSLSSSGSRQTPVSPAHPPRIQPSSRDRLLSWWHVFYQPSLFFLLIFHDSCTLRMGSRSQERRPSSSSLPSTPEFFFLFFFHVKGCMQPGWCVALSADIWGTLPPRIPSLLCNIIFFCFWEMNLFLLPASPNFLSSLYSNVFFVNLRLHPCSLTCTSLIGWSLESASVCMCHHTTHNFLPLLLCIQALTLSFLSVQQTLDTFCLHFFAPPPFSRGSVVAREHGRSLGGKGVVWGLEALWMES